jgi:hypothetical protein
MIMNQFSVASCQCFGTKKLSGVVLREYLAKSRFERDGLQSLCEHSNSGTE